jgi:hypothetical protein
MVAKVTLTHKVEVFVKTKSDEQLQDWLNATTPSEAKELAEKNGKYVSQDYSEEILCHVQDNSDYDIDISET